MFALIAFCCWLLSSIGQTNGQSTEQRIILDPGHGGKDRGALWGGVHEADLNLKIALEVEKILKQEQLRVTMTRRTDIFVSLEQRAKVANRYPNSLFISIHFNAFSDTRIRGFETYYAGAAGYQLARSIHRQYANSIKLKNRGLHRRPYSILTHTKHSAALIECGFLSNKTERNLVTKAAFQKQIAQAIAQGIINAP
jgi:N-acetylmuramoyl-L-alanine amidase